MKNYLAIDTCGKNLTVIAEYNGKREVYFNSDCGVNHSTELMVRVEEVLSKLGVSVKDLDFIACVVGAGSFTGIRIGVSTVKALCLSSGKKCLPVTSFDVLSYNKPNAKVLALIDAHHGGYYACGYDKGKIVLEPKYILKDELDKIKDGYKLISFEEIEGYDVEVVSLEKGLLNAVDKLKDNLIDAENLQPLYLRKSQAEEGRP